MKKIDISYNADSIDVIDGLEAIRGNSTDMYAGSKVSAAFHCFNEIVDNSIDEVLNKYADLIEVYYNETNNTVKVVDNGRGIPVGINKKFNVSAVQLIFTKLHSGGKFNKKNFKISGGKNGVGLGVVNALSEITKVEIKREGKIYEIEFSKGKVKTPLKEIGKCKKNETGTSILFKPDKTVLKNGFDKLNEEEIKKGLELRSYTNNVKIVYHNEDTQEDTTYYHENGIIDLLKTYVSNPITDILSKEFTDDGNLYKVAFCWGNELGERFETFVNGIHMIKGTNETGVKYGLNNIITFLKENKMIPKNVEIKGEDIREGLVCVSIILHKLPEFKGQTKDELSNSDVVKPIKDNISEMITDYLNDPQNRKQVSLLTKRIIELSKKKKQMLDIRKKLVYNTNSLEQDSSFADATSDDREKCQVILCEGDSASGSLKLGRNTLYQAILPLRGKIKDVYGCGIKTIVANEVIKGVLKAIFGTNDVNKIRKDWKKIIRYGQIIGGADSDIDGYHIISLLLTLFNEVCPDLLKEGYFYVAISPLYRVQEGNSFRYFKNDDEFNQYQTKKLSSIFKVTRGESLGSIISKKDSFMADYSIFKNNYQLTNEMIDNCIYLKGDLNEILNVVNDYGLEVEQLDENKEEYEVSGFIDNDYQFFLIDEDFLDSAKKLSEYFEDYTLDYTKNGNEIKDATINDFILDIEKYKIPRNRLKGLGESDYEELFDTTFDMDKGNYIRVKISDGNQDSVDQIQKILFGSNSDLRKKFINEKIMK